MIRALYAAAGAAAHAYGRLRGLGSDAAAEAWRERCDPSAGASAQAGVWIHAASVGETALAASLARALHERVPETPVMLTCKTATGRAAATAAGMEFVRYLPLDRLPVLADAFDTFQPKILVVVEAELWPNLLRTAGARGVPVYFVNAKLSERSAERYRKAADLFAPGLAAIGAVFARDDDSAARFAELGVDPARIEVAGDLKFDAPLPEPNAKGRASEIGFATREAPLFVAASTREGEEEQVLAAFAQVLSAAKDARLVIAPRHPERFDAVWSLIERGSLSAVRRSRWASAQHASARVMLLDGVGELRAFFPGAAGAFVGGTLADLGGHNVLEPAAAGVPVAVGPSVATVAGQVDALAEAGGLVRVGDASELGAAWTRWAREPDAARDAGAAGRAVVAASQGGMARVASAIADAIEGGP